MAKHILKEYWYLNKSLSVIQSDHPGRTKEGTPKPPNKKDVVCWTEKGCDVWYFPDGSTHPCSEEDYGRSELMAILTNVAAHGESKQKEKSKGQVNMFSDMDEEETEVKRTHKKSGMPVLPDVILAAMERQSLGFHASGFMSPTEQAILNIEFVSEPEFSMFDKMYGYNKIMASKIGYDPDPFWRYAIEREWKPKWKLEWADLVYRNNCEQWRAEVIAF